MFIGLHVPYLQQMVTAMPTTNVQIDTWDERQMAKVSPCPADGDPEVAGEYISVVMPMRLE